MVKCNICGSNMIFDSKGIHCPICKDKIRRIKVKTKVYNDLKYYIVIKSLNVCCKRVILEKELSRLIEKGINVEVE